MLGGSLAQLTLRDVEPGQNSTPALL